MPVLLVAEYGHGQCGGGDDDGGDGRGVHEAYHY